MPTKVKICGITRVEDARLAVSSGAWAIGMIFHEPSERYCEPARATEIAESVRREVEVAGVFVNASLDEITVATDSIPMTMVQLHGEEGPSYCAEVSRSTGLKVIKVARVRDAASVRALGAYKTDFHMLDSYEPDRPGGTGQSFDWELAALHPSAPPLILSGGLAADNVAAAIAAVRPFAVDVASGVEGRPGLKDPLAVKDFFAAVERATAAA